MFQFFRINDPYRLVVVFFIAIAIRLVYFLFDIPPTIYELKWLLLGERLGDGFVMYKEAFDYTAPLSAFVYKALDIVFGRSLVAHQLVATLFLCFNAALFNLLLVRNRAYEENNFLPALFYVLITLSLPDLCSLSPQLMSTTFVLLSLNNVLRRIDNQLGEELFLHAGLYLGIAALFYLPALLFSFLFFVAFVLFSSAKARRIVLYLYGLLLPIAVLYGIFAWQDSGSYFFEMYFGGLWKENIQYVETPKFYYYLGLIFFWLLVGLYGSTFLARRGNYESRIFQVMLLFAVTAAVILFIDRELSITQLMYFALPLSYFLTYYFLSIRKFVWKSAMPVLLVISLVAAPYFLYEAAVRVQPVSEPAILSNSREVMLLTDSLDKYQEYHMVSPFFDKAISRDQLRRLDYYASAMDSYYAISKKYPLVIVDEWGYMSRYFEVFPEMRNNYVEIRKDVYKLKN